MSSPSLDPDWILDALDRLHELGAQVSRRLSQLEQEAREKDRLARRRIDAARVSIQEQLQKSIAAAETELADQLARVEAHAHSRVARIRRAQVSARKYASQRIEAEEGRKKLELQRELLHASRERDAYLTESRIEFETITKAIDAAESELTAHETEARNLLGVFGPATLRSLAEAHEKQIPPPDVPAAESLQSLISENNSLAQALLQFRRRPLPALSRAWPVSLLLVLATLGAIPVLPYLRLAQAPTPLGMAALAAGFALIAAVLHAAGHTSSRSAVNQIVNNLGRSRILLRACRESASRTHNTRTQEVQQHFDHVSARCNDAWERLAESLKSIRSAAPTVVDARGQKLLTRHETMRSQRQQRLRRTHEARVAALQAESVQRIAAAERDATQATGSASDERSRASNDSRSAIHGEGFPLIQKLQELQHAPVSTPTDLRQLASETWTPPKETPSSVRIGTIEADISGFLEVAGKLPSPGIQPAPSQLVLPLALTFPNHGSLVLEASQANRPLALGTLNHVACRLLASIPPGRLAFTFFDPVGLGQSFAGMTHLSDEAEHVIGGRIWTQPGQLEERLAELNLHLERVIQTYLRDDYSDIVEYNNRAGNIAEKYRFLVIADFPAGFSDVALKHLGAIASAGGRCGIFILVHWNSGTPIATPFPTANLTGAGLHLVLDGNSKAPVTAINGRPRNTPALRALPDPVPPPEVLAAIVHDVARASRDSNRIEVPFEHIAPSANQIWSLDTATEIRVPIGRTGATKLQYLALGKGTRQHVLVAGKTGSGKSTLFHVLITNLALWAPPDQIEFYLIDFKKGVEFKCYATHQLPHARVIAIESDRDFGLSVLQKIDEELRRRGELFRAANVQDISAYRRSAKALPMPRTLLLIDEFQEFFVEEDRIAQNASVLLDRIVRQGRAFGVHVVLGSQTLGGAYTVARTTLGQMVVRIALQCNEADATLIMDEENPAPRLLSRPGEAIYNDEAGATAGNSPFQIVWISDESRDRHLARVHEAARAHQINPAPLVFEGDAPADITQNEAFQTLRASLPNVAPTTLRIWLGSPNSIKGPTEVSFSCRSGDHLLVVGQRNDAMLAILAIAQASILSGHPHGSASITVLDGSPPDSSDARLLARLADSCAPHVTRVRPPEAADTIRRLHAAFREAADTSAHQPAQRRFLFIHHLESVRALRQEDEFSFSSGDSQPHPGALLKEILAEGPPLGFHVVVTCDTWNNVNRFLGRKGLSEFGSRVLFQMSAADSASLIDNPVGNRLGLHRAVLFDDREGSLEVFRPYAIPAFDQIAPSPSQPVASSAG